MYIYKQKKTEKLAIWGVYTDAEDPLSGQNHVSEVMAFLYYAQQYT